MSGRLKSTSHFRTGQRDSTGQRRFATLGGEHLQGLSAEQREAAFALANTKLSVLRDHPRKVTQAILDAIQEVKARPQPPTIDEEG